MKKIKKIEIALGVVLALAIPFVIALEGGIFPPAGTILFLK